MSTLKRTIFGAVFAACIAAPAVMMGAGSNTEAAAKLSIGDTAPAFTLTDLDGNTHSLSDYTDAGNIVVLEWYSPTCPFVRKHYRNDTGTMLNIQQDLDGQDVVWLRINSAHAGHGDADSDFNIKQAKEWGITTPILMDTSGDVGKSYGAKRTPDMYIISADGTLAYHGAIDNRSDAAAPGEVNYVSNAVEEMLSGKPVTKASTKPYGCRVKYD